jgi:drug/metabolite transporter (DMT)-like permease
MIGEASGLGGAASWAVITAIMRHHSQHLSPVMINGLRCVFAAFTLAAIVIALGQLDALSAIPLEGAAIIILSGLLGQALGDGLYIWSLKLIGASRALPVSNIHPLLTMVLAMLLLGEPVTVAVLAGGLFVLAGVYLVAFPFGPLRQIGHLLDTPDRRGLLLAAGAAVCWSLSTIMLKTALESMPLLPANLLRMSTAAVLLIGLEVILERGHAATVLPRRSLVIMALAGILNAFSSLMFLSAILYAGAAKAAVLVATSPLFGLPLSFLFLKEQINRRIIAGTLVAVVGIWLVVSG